ncbi:MAG: hypothetical protein RL098_837 [Bacteroidota bacterium]
MTEQQRTLKGSLVFEGVGLHTGEKVRLEICPAPANHGYKFQRTDLDNEPIIKADADYVVATDRGTTLEQNGARVYTTEHVLAALYGCQVDNALIKLNGPEIPIMDGSALPFVKAIEAGGYEEQDAVREYFELTENIPWEDLEKGIEFLAIPDVNYRLTVMVDYNSPVLGTQHASMYHLGEFNKEIAHCRTFVFLRELEYLAKNNLIKGGDLDNAIVLVDRPDVSQTELDDLAELLGKDKLQVSIDGIGVLNSSKLQCENEPARHKLLDIVGDLALVGKPIKAHILAARPGHSGNVRFAKVLKEQIKKQQQAGRVFDLRRYRAHATPPLPVLNGRQNHGDPPDLYHRGQEHHHERTHLYRALPRKSSIPRRIANRSHGTSWRYLCPVTSRRPTFILHLFHEN